MEISDSLAKIADKVGPVAVGRAVPGDHHIIEPGARLRCEFGSRQRAQTTAGPIAAHRIADFS